MLSLFNKSGQGTTEVRSFIPHIDPDENFEKLKPYLERESVKVEQAISVAMYSRAKTHYQSNDFNVEGQPDQTKQKRDRLVYLIRDVVAINGYLEYAPNNDVIHSINGRREHWSDNSKPATEWKVRDQEAAQRKQAHLSMNALLAYLELERAIFTEWRDSPERAKQRSLFIQDYLQWADVHPMGNDPLLFHYCYSFFREYQDAVLQISLGDHYQAIETKLKAGTEITGSDLTLLSHARKSMGYAVLVKALKELPVQLIPGNIIQKYSGDRLSLKGSQVATREVLSPLINELETKQRSAEKVLDLKVQALQNDVATSTESEENPTNTKFLSF